MPDVAQIVVHTPEELKSCCAHLADVKRFGFDTEFVGEDSYHPRLCLIQVATSESLYLIDPFSLDSLEPFWKLVVDPAHQVVVHAGREEVRICHIATGQAPARLFDLQIAAGFVGLTYPLSHGALVQQVLGIKLSKGETLTEWRTRPLTKAQIGYAFDDVRFLLAIHDKLSERLDKLGRAPWAEEEFARLREQATPDDEGLSVSADKWRRLRGAGGLDRRRLAILREVFYWREKEAADANRPARTILRDDLIVEIARRNPKAAKDLVPVRGMAKRHADAIYDAIERGRAIPLEQCPEPVEREQDPPQVALIQSVLLAVLADFAAKERLAANLVATTGDIKQLVKAHVEGGPAPQGPLMRGWRAQHVLPHLRGILDGKESIRIRDPRSEAPFDYKPN